MMQPLLEIRKLRRNYGYRPVVRDVDLRIAPGELVCLLGPNGAGKSSLLAALTSRNPPDGGEILLDGESANDLNSRQRHLARIGFLGHAPGIFLDLSARENLNFFYGLQHGNVDAKVRREIVEALLHRAGLGERMDGDRVRAFSRGMQQRLGLCRVFLSRPRLILLDEPLTGLDREGAATLVEFLRESLAVGSAALITTHDEDFFRDIAQRYVFLKSGRLIADVPVDKYTGAARAKVHGLLYGN